MGIQDSGGLACQKAVTKTVLFDGHFLCFNIMLEAVCR